MKIIDISMPVREGMVTYPGDPPYITRVAKESESGAIVSMVSMGAHTGTHIDAPAHFILEGATVDQIDLDDLVGPCTVLELEGVGDIDAEMLRSGIGEGPMPQRLLLKTDGSKLGRSGSFAESYPALTPDAAVMLASAPTRLVGVDYLSVERRGRPGSPVHHTLLSAGTVILEGLDLTSVTPGRYVLIALPLRLEGVEGSPARAVLIDARPSELEAWG